MYQPSVTYHPTPKFTAIDAHTHVELDGADVAVDIMDSVGLSSMVNLTGGTVLDFKKGIHALKTAHPGRFAVMVTFDFTDLDDPQWGPRQADGLEAAVAAGASGLKELKRLGLEIRDRAGRLLALDDPRLDPVWDRCGTLGVPVCIHTSDPLAFHQPLTIRNERTVELQAHPDWVFMRPGLPTKSELLNARNSVMARHRNTTFVCVHVANYPEDLVTVSHWLDDNPNMYVDVAARFVEIGRHHPEMVRNFFNRYQDRILFGTDTGVSSRHVMLGVEMHSDSVFFKREDFKEAFLYPYFQSMYRYLETDDYYIPSPTPVQGSWPLHGIELADDVLKKVYCENALKLFPALAPRQTLQMA